MNNEEFLQLVDKIKQESINETDIQNIMNTIDDNNNSYLENNSIEKILKDISDILTENSVTDIENKVSKLINYRYVDELCDIHKGKNLKLIRKIDNKFFNGGLVLDIKFLDNGTHIMCKNFHNIKQYKFDDFFCFQKLTNEELLILMANDLI